MKSQDRPTFDKLGLLLLVARRERLVGFDWKPVAAALIAAIVLIAGTVTTTSTRMIAMTIRSSKSVNASLRARRVVLEIAVINGISC